MGPAQQCAGPSHLIAAAPAAARALVIAWHVQASASVDKNQGASLGLEEPYNQEYFEEKAMRRKDKSHLNFIHMTKSLYPANRSGHAHARGKKIEQ
jgi:hypothetical protein